MVTVTPLETTLNSVDYIVSESDENVTVCLRKDKTTASDFDVTFTARQLASVEALGNFCYHQCKNYNHHAGTFRC